MPDPYDSDPYEAAAVPGAPVFRGVDTSTVGNPAAAQEYMRGHRQRADAMGKQAEEAQAARQKAIDEANAILDQTTAALKASREGRSNLSLLAMGAGMLSTPGNFGQQVGGGLKAMIPAIAQQRAEEDDYQSKMAQIAMRRAALNDAPLKDRLAYIRAVQLGDMNAVRDIEKAIVRTQAGDETAQTGQINKMLQQARESIKQQFASSEGLDPKLLQDAVNEEFLRLVQLHNDTTTSGRKVDVDAARRYANIGQPSVQSVDTKTALQRAQEAATSRKRFDVPSEDQRKAAGVPKLAVPSPYEGIDTDTARKMYGTATTAFEKTQKDVMDDLASAADMAQKGKQFLADYDASSRTGGVGGMAPALGSTEAGRMDQLGSQMQLGQVPKGQGAVSDYERKLFGRMTMNRTATRDQNKFVSDILDATHKRLQEMHDFQESYFRVHRTTAGMTQAWDRYINSPEGRVLTEDSSGNIKPNEKRVPWREFFGRDDKKPVKPVPLGAEYD